MPGPQHYGGNPFTGNRTNPRPGMPGPYSALPLTPPSTAPEIPQPWPPRG